MQNETEKSNGFKLIEAILELSQATDWDNARLEWYLSNIKFLNEAETCACGHYPIYEQCTITNRLNDNILHVGNVCVKKFMPELQSQLICSGLKKLLKGKLPNAETTLFLLKLDIINEYERKFIKNLWRKKNLTENQANFKIVLIEKIQNKINKCRPKI